MKVAVIRMKRKHAKKLRKLLPGSTAHDIIIMAVEIGLDVLSERLRASAIKTAN